MLSFGYSLEFLELIEQGKVQAPERQTKNSAGYDIFMPIAETLTINPRENIEIDLGLWLNTDAGEAYKILEIYPRSSTAKKKGLVFLSQNYKFSIGNRAVIQLYNYTTKPVTIEPNERLIQAVICEVGDLNRAGDYLFEPVSSHKDLVGEMIINQFFQFQVAGDLTIAPLVVDYLATGIKANIPDGTFLQLDMNEQLIASFPVMMANTAGIVDADYYNNKENEGHIKFPILNLGYLSITVPNGTRLGYGTVRKYFLIGDETPVIANRVGGLGSTLVSESRVV